MGAEEKKHEVESVAILAVMHAAILNAEGLSKVIEESGSRPGFKDAWASYRREFSDWYNKNISEWKYGKASLYRAALAHQAKLATWRDALASETGETPIFLVSAKGARVIPSPGMITKKLKRGAVSWMKWSLLIGGGAIIGWYVTRKLGEYFPAKGSRESLNGATDETEEAA